MLTSARGWEAGAGVIFGREGAALRRNILLAGAVLTLAAMIVVPVGAALDLELESVVMLGAAMGAVVALVPDGTPGSRLAGFGAGFVIVWIGYAVRAALLPDTSAGRAVTVGLVMITITAVAVAANGRLSLWSVLLGAGAFAGAYEFTYTEAPPQVITTSISTATTMAFTVAAGFLAAALVAPLHGGAARREAEGAQLDEGMPELAEGAAK